MEERGKRGKILYVGGGDGNSWLFSSSSSPLIPDIYCRFGSVHIVVMQGAYLHTTSLSPPFLRSNIILPPAARRNGVDQSMAHIRESDSSAEQREGETTEKEEKKKVFSSFLSLAPDTIDVFGGVGPFTFFASSSTSFALLLLFLLLLLLADSFSLLFWAKSLVVFLLL